MLHTERISFPPWIVRPREMRRGVLPGLKSAVSGDVIPSLQTSSTPRRSKRGCSDGSDDKVGSRSSSSSASSAKKRRQHNNRCATEDDERYASTLPNTTPNKASARGREEVAGSIYSKQHSKQQRYTRNRYYYDDIRGVEGRQRKAEQVMLAGT